MKITDDLISTEIGYFKPSISKRRQIAEAVVGVLLIVAFFAFFIWIAQF